MMSKRLPFLVKLRTSICHCRFLGSHGFGLVGCEKGLSLLCGTRYPFGKHGGNGASKWGLGDL